MDYLKVLEAYYQKNQEKLKQGIIDPKLQQALDTIEKKVPDFKKHYKKVLYISNKFFGMLLTMPISKEVPKTFETEGHRFMLIDTEEKWKRMVQLMKQATKTMNDTNHKTADANLIKCYSLWRKFSAHQKD